MIKILVEDVTDSTKETGLTEYDISMEEMEKVMDKNADKVMSQTLMEKSTLYFQDGRVVEYTFDKKEKSVHKRIGKIKSNETDKTEL